MIVPNSILANLLESCIPLNPRDRAHILEDSEELESVYNNAARQGDSAIPDNAEEDVDFHFVCFVKSPKNNHIYELDGDRKGPVDRGILSRPDEDMLAEGCLNIVKEFIQRENDVNFNFSLMALVLA